MTSHVRQADRLQQILDAASVIIEREGVSGLTMKALASDAGISRAWLYEFFPNLESILIAIRDRARTSVVGSIGPPSSYGNVHAHVLQCAQRWRAMPTAALMIALYGVGNAPSESNALYAAISDSIYHDWVRPLVASGVDPKIAMTRIYSVRAAVLSVLLANRRGELSDTEATRAIESTVGALVPSEWVIRRAA